MTVCDHKEEEEKKDRAKSLKNPEAQFEINRKETKLSSDIWDEGEEYVCLNPVLYEGCRQCVCVWFCVSVCNLIRIWRLSLNCPAGITLPFNKLIQRLHL